MFSYAERLLAFRYMRAKRREGFVSIITAFSVLGITLGVATLILVTSLMNGIREEMTENFVGVDGHITIYGPGRYFTGSELLLAEIESKFEDGGIASISERIEGQVMVTGNGRSLGAQVMGMHEGDIAGKPRIAQSLSEGALEAYHEGRGVIIGEGLLRNLGLKIGQPITLISPQGRATIAGVVPRIKAYPVVGTFKLGMHSIDSALMLMPYAEARVYFGLPESEGGIASAVQLTLENPQETEKFVAYLRNELLAGQPYRILGWQETNASIFTALQVQQRVMIVILALIILVAAFNIISSLIMLVQDKAKEIAILRSMGATRGMVLRIFLLSGMSIGLMGTAAGVLLGLLGAAYIDQIRQFIEKLIGQPILIENIYFLSSLPTRTDPMEVLAVIGLAVLLSFLSTLYPAWKAASYQPAEALRYD
jgi:lipoprotein-releasing system permease protein